MGPFLFGSDHLLTWSGGQPAISGHLQCLSQKQDIEMCVYRIGLSIQTGVLIWDAEVGERAEPGNQGIEVAVIECTTSNGQSVSV